MLNVSVSASAVDLTRERTDVLQYLDVRWRDGVQPQLQTCCSQCGNTLENASLAGVYPRPRGQ